MTVPGTTNPDRRRKKKMIAEMVNFYASMDEKLENQDLQNKKTSRSTVSTAAKAAAVKCSDFSVLQKMAQQTGGKMNPAKAAASSPRPRSCSS